MEDLVLYHKHVLCPAAEVNVLFVFSTEEVKRFPQQFVPSGVYQHKLITLLETTAKVRNYVKFYVMVSWKYWWWRFWILWISEILHLYPFINFDLIWVWLWFILVAGVVNSALWFKPTDESPVLDGAGLPAVYWNQFGWCERKLADWCCKRNPGRVIRFYFMSHTSVY